MCGCTLNTSVAVHCTLSVWLLLCMAHWCVAVRYTLSGWLHMAHPCVAVSHTHLVWL